MKNKLLLILCVSLATATSYAAFVGQGVPVSTVSEAMKMSDESRITLQGYIQKHLSKDNYLFRDQTGEITIEIDDEDWKGIDVTPQDKVEISGDIDKDFFDTEIDVDGIKLIK